MSRADAGRLIHLSKKRERAKEDMEQQLKKMEEESSKLAAGISSKFTANYDAVEENLKSKTVGLVTLDEMREKQKDVVNDRCLIDPFFYKFYRFFAFLTVPVRFQGGYSCAW
ncbi:hypothetical protein OESDEN_05479 [Oesophagostomum dentatum]|uniref:Uncharacterized protein n=1 Tax=Oesophagostomum dentatum TaxID=61180 RepID=A0A0B1TBE5_OESDE|nr:hypothetical protein OESDEN_05479 [Oesophagostomum dentatum]